MSVQKQKYSLRSTADGLTLHEMKNNIRPNKGNEKEKRKEESRKISTYIRQCSLNKRAVG